MHVRAVVLTASLVNLSSCAAMAANREARRQAEAERQSRLRTISVVGFLVGAGKVDGTQWDGPGIGVGEAATKAVSVALAAPPPANVALAVAGVLAGPTIQALAKPDISGTVELFSNRQLVGQHALPQRPDTFSPQWAGGGFSDVDTGNDLRLRVTLRDDDIGMDDDVGVIEIGNAKIEEAREAGQVLSITVAEQSSNQILFLKLSVM